MQANKRLLIGVAATLSLLAAVTPAQATAADDVSAQSGWVRLYEHADYGGGQMYTNGGGGAGGECVNVPQHWANIASSLKTNTIIDLFDNKDCNYGLGRRTGDTPWLGDANDKVESIRIF